MKKDQRQSGFCFGDLDGLFTSEAAAFFNPSVAPATNEPEAQDIHAQIEACEICNDRKASVAVGESFPCDAHFKILYAQQRASMLGISDND